MPSKTITTEHCQNCGQSILPGDTACWQCGQQVDGATGLATDEPAADRTETEASMLVIYTIWTIIVILVTLLLLLLLTRQPSSLLLALALALV